MQEEISRLLINLSKRAEKIDPKTLIDTFVDVGPLVTVLSTIDNQVLYGRRGTGKTHALAYASGAARAKGDIPVYIDLRSVGSTGGIYSDTAIPFAERATRLLMDTLAALHDELLACCVDDLFDLNLSEVGPILDELAEAITEVVVTGDVKREVESHGETSRTSDDGFKASASLKDVTIGTESKSSNKFVEGQREHITTEGKAYHRVHFGKVGSAFQRLSKVLKGKRIWLLIDEWSVVPLDLQPYLADLFRRAIFPASSVTVKIGAIEKRSRFQQNLPGGDYLGIELGGDASADLNMDDFMVFDNDEDRAFEFFKTLLYRHVNALATQDDLPVPPNATDLLQIAFTQENVFREFVKATEGIPRDGFYILSIAAQRDYGKPIQMSTIRKAAKTWYERDKESSVSANPFALNLLHWIIDEVIAHRRARAFLLERNTSHNLIDSLFDSRVLHLLKRNISAHDDPGKRYDVYKIDYGCYVDLLSTARSPQGLLEMDDGTFIDVPSDDYRAIRRAILDLEVFELSATDIKKDIS